MSANADLLQKIHQVVHRAWTKSAKDLDITHSEFEYLNAVQEQADLQRFEDAHGQHLQDIVDALGVSKASASAMISKLERSGYVTRFQCQMDARASHIILTDTGQIKLARGRKLYELAAQALAEELSQISTQD